MKPIPFDPYVYGAQVHRVIDGDSIKLQLDMGFGLWWLCTVAPGADKEAKYPQGVYRLMGINTPEMSESQGQAALDRVNELISLGADGDRVLVKTHKERLHGKYRYMIDLLVPTKAADDGVDYEEEAKHWLTDEELEDLLKQTDNGLENGRSTIRSLVSEILYTRKKANSVIHVNQQLIDEGLAKPYWGGAK